MVEYLFVYGTLKDPDVQKRVTGRTLNGEADAIADHAVERITLSEGTYPILVDAIGREVHGLVLEITSADFEPLDVYETNAYQRVKVTLKGGKEAWVYKKA